MTDEEHKNPPKTVTEIGIHIGYIREDLLDIKESLNNSPSRREHDSLEKRVTKIESTLDGIKGTIAKWAITILVGMILALYGIDNI